MSIAEIERFAADLQSNAVLAGAEAIDSVCAGRLAGISKRREIARHVSPVCPRLEEPSGLCH